MSNNPYIDQSVIFSPPSTDLTDAGNMLKFVQA